MNCIECGIVQPEDAKYCQNCGTSLLPVQLCDPKGILKNPGLGLASFILSIVMFVFFIVTLIQAGLAEENSPNEVVIGVLIITGLLVTLVGTGFGIAGIVQKNKAKTLTVLGLIFNSIILLGVIALLILGSY